MDASSSNEQKRKTNAAQRLLESLGVAVADAPKQARGNKEASATKTGPGRYAKHGKPGNRTKKARKTRAYVALMAAAASKRVTKAKHRDERGAYTCVGPVYEVYGMNPDEGREHVIGAGKESDGTVFYSARRKWLAGISAQRGY